MYICICSCLSLDESAICRGSIDLLSFSAHCLLEDSSFGWGLASVWSECSPISMNKIMFLLDANEIKGSTFGVKFFFLIKCWIYQPNGSESLLELRVPLPLQRHVWMKNLHMALTKHPVTLQTTFKQWCKCRCEWIWVITLIFRSLVSHGLSRMHCGCQSVAWGCWSCFKFESLQHIQCYSSISPQTCTCINKLHCAHSFRPEETGPMTEPGFSQSFSPFVSPDGSFGSFESLGLPLSPLACLVGV